MKALSKQLHELVVEERFIVNDVIAKSYQTSFTPNAEVIYGGYSHVYKGSFISKLVLKVSPDSKDVPVKFLNFEGFSIVKAGDYISAKIPRYEEKKVEGGCSISFCRRERIFYSERKFNPIESAIELAILSNDEKILRRDRAVDFERFVKDF